MVPVGDGGGRRPGSGRGPQRLHASARPFRAVAAPGLPSRENGGRSIVRDRRHGGADPGAHPGRSTGILITRGLWALGSSRVLTCFKQAPRDAPAQVAKSLALSWSSLFSI